MLSESNMHQSAMATSRIFFDVYTTMIASGRVVDIGAQNVNGSLREVCPAQLQYLGLDFVKANGVDIVLDDPYQLPLQNDSVDFVVSSSCFEHSEMFWLLFLEVLRVLRPSGLFYLNVPSNGEFHRYPVDCWRFYPDSGNALVSWAKRNGYDPLLLESFIGKQSPEGWSDCVAVFIKDKSRASEFPNRIVHVKRDFSNGQIAGQPGFLNLKRPTEDQEKVMARPAFWPGTIPIKYY
jgi:SAM-dependent methyltransferase